MCVCLCLCVEMRPVPCSCWTEPADVTHWLSAQQAQETDPAGGWGRTQRLIHTHTQAYAHIYTHTHKSNKQTPMLMQKSTGTRVNKIWIQTQSDRCAHTLTPRDLDRDWYPWRPKMTYCSPYSNGSSLQH